ncbi:unnamed protein product [Urochloa decumbens]
MVDATKLWELDAYDGLPHVQLSYPMVCESFYVKEHGYKTEWLILVDMRSKTLRSVHRYDQGSGFFRGKVFHPSSLSNYFNSSQSCSDGQEASVRKSNTDCQLPPLVVANEQLTDITSNLKAPPSTGEEKIFAVLEEIPGLACEDMQKAYSILNHDSYGRQFRSLLGLPMNLRKEWLLMEIKTSEDCSLCSACTANSQLG